MNIRRLLLIAATLVSFSATTHAEIKIGFVNAAQILDKAPQANAAREKLKKEFQPRDREIIAKQEKLKNMEAKLTRESAVMSQEKRNDLNADIREMRRDIKRSQDDFRDDFALRRNEAIAEFQKQVQEVILEFAKREKYDAIISEGVVYANEKTNITDDILAELKGSFSGK